MSSQITDEVILLLMSIYGGLVLIVCYDLLCVLRNVFGTSKLRIVVEDIVFWILASIFIFDIFLKYNYGRPRYFALGAVLGTMILFQLAVGRRFVKKISVIIINLLNILLKPLKKICNVIKLKIIKFQQFIMEKVSKCHRHKEDNQLHPED